MSKVCTYYFGNGRRCTVTTNDVSCRCSRHRKAQSHEPCPRCENGWVGKKNTNGVCRACAESMRRTGKRQEREGKEVHHSLMWAHRLGLYTKADREAFIQELVQLTSGKKSVRATWGEELGFETAQDEQEFLEVMAEEVKKGAPKEESKEMKA